LIRTRTFAVAASNENKTRFAAEIMSLKQKGQPMRRLSLAAYKKPPMR
jgi:hypothetical protein